MKLVALVGTNASYSYNRKLLWYMKKRFGQLAQIDVLEISDLPLFSEDTLDRPDSVLFLSNKIAEADGLIISTPEYDHSITAALKSVLEWLSWGDEHPLTKKPIMIVGASLGNMGTVFAQENLRQILNSPGIDAFVLPGNQFLLGRASQSFSERGDLTEEKTIHWLEHCFNNFVGFVKVINPAKEKQPQFIDDVSEQWWIEDASLGLPFEDDADTGSTEDLDDGTSLFA
ncbi:NADPH-dependent FMN reductase [Lactococcus fujiensis]|uniref:NADPH-dependent FMN reductase-like domain-containing protein n=1 Tax=Lactococcus fujiensis JCM 16395 TaxID=1291764 RepID=A0A2A5RN04_9LACT|nr:NADPH-dependent FMN reductase [Lactococcus fujiensis]PCS00715.1 hypothetical protein RT41_GL001097 [Lactococcus fujiensis JCM 16395]